MNRPTGNSPVQIQASYSRGALIAAYLYLPATHPRRSVRCEEVGDGMIVDIGEAGRPIGIDISDPAIATRDSINRVLGAWGLPPITDRDLRPLKVA